MQVKKVLTSVALAVAAIGSANAAVFPDFTVDPDMINGGSTFVADKITGGYNERVSFDGLGGFSVTLYWNAGQFFANNGADQIFPITSRLGVDYGLYAVMTASGTVVPTANGAIFTTTSGTVDMYYDPSVNSTFSFAGDGGTPVAVGNSGDDILLATGNILAPSGGVLDNSLATCQNGINCGSFGQRTSFSLTTDGENFFTQPVPFYNISFQSGQLNSFALDRTQDINGSLDVIFVGIPEPTSLALAGLALLGLGAARRRRG